MTTAIAARPAYGPVDEVTRARLRRQLIEFFGSHPSLDAHLALLDARGAWYAERALTVWRRDHLDAFFGVVRHVVRTQFDGPPPSPDVEGWLQAGRPDDRQLAEVYDLIALCRYGHKPEDGVLARHGEPGPAVTAIDHAIASWPKGQWFHFVNAYARFEVWIERLAITLPAIDF